MENIENTEKEEKFVHEPGDVSRKLEKHLFMEWLATPIEYRRPKDQKGFANKYDVSEQTLCNWKNDDDFLNEVSVYRKKRYLTKATEVVESLYKKAKKTGDAKESKLFLEYVGDYTEKKNVKIDGLASLLKEAGEDEDPLVK